jgi:hypothetical protein
LVLSRNRQALTGDVSIRVEDGEIIAGKLLTLHQFINCSMPDIEAA